MSLMLACGQFAPVPGSIEANRATMLSQMEEAKSLGASLIVFPELALTGYLPPDEVGPLAVPVNGPELRPLHDAAARLGVGAAVGLAELHGDVRFNSLAYINSRGQVSHVYRKLHLWDTERTWATPGRSLDTFDAEGVRTGMWVCYDTRFPAVGRLVAVGGGSLALVATAWLGPAAEWELALRARALDNGMHVAASALQGAYANNRFGGDSLIVDPHGNVLVRCPEGRTGVITAPYDSEVVARFRGRVPLLRHRRLDAYNALSQESEW